MRSNNLSRLNWLLFNSMSAKFHVYIAKLFTIMQSHWDIVRGVMYEGWAGIKIKRWQRPITYFHNISGHKICNAESVSRVTCDNLSRVSGGFPRLLPHLSHCARRLGVAETRQRCPPPLWGGVTHGVKETELYLPPPLFPNGQPFNPFQPITLI